MKHILVLTLILIATAACFGQARSVEQKAAQQLSMDDEVACSASESLWMSGTVQWQQWIGRPSRLTGVVLQQRSGMRHYVRIETLKLTSDEIAKTLPIGRFVRVQVERCGNNSSLREIGPPRL